ncbi:MAG: Nif11 family protein [Acidobacteriota bacterium]
MSHQLAREFFEKLNTTPSLQETVLTSTDTTFQELASEAGFECTAEALREVAEEEFAGRRIQWSGRIVTWRPDVEDGVLVSELTSETTDARLTESELDLVSAGGGPLFPCTLPDCPTDCGGK